MAAEEIKAVEARLLDAMLRSDVGELKALLGDDLVFTNHAGQRLSKGEDIEAHRSGLLSIESLVAEGEPLIRQLGDTAIVWVTLNVIGTYDGQAFGGRFAYTRVWVRNGDCWQIETAHCSQL